ncbi:MAG: 1-phosphofructokinase [Brevibacillus sp.]|jgi:1-phosphofructokinase|uniref:Tagatose-6-phosphate kinase n=1 Tax=Brevibacillus aydinogluensis TaxID=927786 RepID=A0AA48MCL3_9BACL|nr:1-phosphofructokinase [Brevibacillus aydinogluensis]REK65538.1 MAG: 1-phosphofructokinase [Brevibacillus sp.]CAJ1004352.1 1-phosphofructokinase [Brevibacillus aydinogluensis]
MIYTVTLNPSIDYHVWVPALDKGTIHEAHKEWKDAGGKGINVSKVLRLLGVDSTALGFVGGFTGAFIRQQVERAGIAHQFLSIEQDSRINIKIKADTETDISGVSPEIPAEALQQLFAQIDLLGPDDYLVLAGSVPKSLPLDIYPTIMKRLQGKGVRVFLDAKGEALKSGLSEQPFLIKPNHHELGELFGVEITTHNEAIACGRKALELGAQNVIVSMAEQGAVFVNREVAFAARIPKRKPVNSIGAGDSMVAGFLYAHTKGWRAEEAFRFAVAAGTTTALSEGFCTHETIRTYLPEISVITVE